MASVVTWDDECVNQLQATHRDLASAGTELRIVVWSADLYAALRKGAGTELVVYANVDAALRSY